MAILMQRYAYMTPTQVRDVLFTTANRTDNGIGKALYGSDGDKLDPKVPDEDYGWGIIDLGKAIYGPGQFFGTFDVAVKGEDVWHNSISDEAIQARGEEDRAQMKKYSKRIAELKALEKLTDQQGWELEYKTKRLASIKDREAQGWSGKLVKHGKGDLTLTAVNSYTGGTDVAEGKLVGMTESFGSAPVAVEGGATLELHKSFTIVKAGQEGEVAVNSNGTDKVSDDAQVVLKKGAVLSLAADQLSLKSLTVQGPATLDVRAANLPEVTFTVDDEIQGADQLKVLYDTSRYSGAKITVDDETVKVNLTAK